MAEYTPMIKQYLEIKKGLMDTIVFYRIGDFYEMFFEDAKIASMELDIVLTGKDAGVEERVPMCGIPFHAANTYIPRLLAKGYKVAIVEQTEDPAKAKGLVKRDIIKVYTPGTYIDESDEKNISYLASITADSISYVITLMDNASGETLYTILDKNNLELEQFLYSMNVKEIIIPSNLDSKLVSRLKENGTITVTVFDDDTELFEYAYLLYGIFEPAIVSSFYRLIHYAKGVCKQELDHLRPIVKIETDNELKMDYYTKKNLELTQTIRLQSRVGTLWNFLDKCKSAMGSRTLRKWVEHPLNDERKILTRQEGIEFLMNDYNARDAIEENMQHVYDIERIIAKLAYKSVNARDLIRLAKTLKHAPYILNAMGTCEAYENYAKLDTCPELLALIDDAFMDQVPLSIKKGGMFRDGYNKELDSIREIKTNGKQILAAIEQRERERTGIKTLKIGNNRVFGYYIEVTTPNLPLVKEEYGYIRKQTLTSGERFITEELKEKEDAIVHAEERGITLEYELFMSIVDESQKYLSKLQKLASALSVFDALYALSKVSLNYGYVKPTFNHNHEVHIVEGRHPIMEQFRKGQLFVANDVEFRKNDTVMLITGPNMGGKSTYMRQMGLIVILAQMGCFVPCVSCDLPLFDQIFTRIGASDDLMNGQSTFMVEMIEANNALENATENSLILFDEIGRGTSTYDGMALAQSMIEYICSAIGAKTLFSTHYHELTSLDQTYSQIKNVHVSVEEENDEIKFLYKMVDGKADRSYGINVAKLAKLPDSLLERAKEILSELENVQVNTASAQQMKVFVKEDKTAKQITELLASIDMDEVSPKEAYNILERLKDVMNRGE